MIWEGIIAVTIKATQLLKFWIENCAQIVSAMMMQIMVLVIPRIGWRKFKCLPLFL